MNEELIEKAMLTDKEIAQTFAVKQADLVVMGDRMVARKAVLKTFPIIAEEILKGVGRGKGCPKIVCLCGSTRFVDTFNEWRKKLTLEGDIVVSIELVLPQSEREDPQHSNYKVKQMLDELHLRKIDIADEVLVLNVGGYIGESTSREIKYAEGKGKPVKYLEALKARYLEVKK